MANDNLLRWSGIAGLLGAVCWTIGDALIVGVSATAADAPLLFETYAARVPIDVLRMCVTASEGRLAAGALIANFSVPLYLAGCWHLFTMLRPAGAKKAWAVTLVLLCGNLWAPLAHASFYFVAMVYQTLARVPPEAHEALLALGDDFTRLLTVSWGAAVGAFALGVLLLGVVIALGKTRWPRWTALLFNPVGFVAFGNLVPWVLPEPAKTLLDGAGFNLGWFMVFAVSLAISERQRREASPQV